jgi:hypothetical protein
MDRRDAGAQGNSHDQEIVLHMKVSIGLNIRWRTEVFLSPVQRLTWAKAMRVASPPSLEG